MKRIATIAKPILILALVACFAALTLMAGCSENSPMDPTPTNTDTAPVLPDPAKLSVDLNFFSKGADVAKAYGHQNFYNAYLRAVIVTAMTDLVLAPPVAAFSLALHTVPNHQQDGSWIWVYTFVDGAEEAQIRLRGMADGDVVRWEMRVTLHDAHHDLDQALWFDGTTSGEGDNGSWTFYEVDLPEMPASGRLEWSNSPSRNELSLTALLGDDAGDSLTISVEGDAARIDFAEGDSDDAWFIRWNESDGTGSLMVPDYNYGEEACWDAQQYDVDCN